MSDDSTRPIVIKRKKVVAGGAHGGAWKIAYADFVTAMMAFFLLMWLLGSTAKGDLQGIADYFQNPMKVAMSGGSGSGDATSILQGGGKDLTRQSGQVKQGDVEAKKSTSFSKEAQLEFRRKELERLETLKADIEKMIEQSPQLAQFKKQLLLDITSEGLRIQIVDEQNRPMFDSGGAELKPYTRDILRQIGKALNGVSNRISLAGHTDAAQFVGGTGGFSNWELSANRANASRRELVSGGMDDTKVLRVVGLASTVLFDKNDPLNSVNRRISIVVLNQKTEMAILQEEGPESNVSTDDDVGDGLDLPGLGKGTPG
jgi:chemotaxis protein MotB